MTDFQTEILNEKLPFGLHICLLYDNDKIRYDFIADFIKIGLKENQKILYLFDSIDSENFIYQMTERHIKIPHKDVIIATARDGYMPSGSFIREEMNQKTIKFSVEAIKDGYIGSRGSGEMTWTLKNMKDATDLMRYESELTDVIKELKYIAVCQYDTRLFSGQTIMDALKTHPIIVIQGKIVKNPFFIEPHIYLQSMTSHPI